MVSERQAEPDPAGVARLLAQALHGDGPRAAALLDRLFRRRLVRFCWGYLQDPRDAEDAVRGVFGQLLRTTPVPAELRAWLYRAARERCLRVLRSTGLGPWGHVGHHAWRAVAGADDEPVRSEADERRARLFHLLGALPAVEREVLRLRYVEDLTRPEIAHVLDVSESVVRSRLFTGMQRLRSHATLLACD